MKKLFLLAALAGSTSLVSVANTAKSSVHNLRKPNDVVHVVGCGVDTYLYGKNQEEINAGIQAIKLAYCWG